MDLVSAGTTVTNELYRRKSQFNGGSSRNTLDYVSYDIVGSKIVMDIGMTLASRSYVSSIESEIRSVLDSIKRDYGIPYTVTYSLGYDIND